MCPINAYRRVCVAAPGRESIKALLGCQHLELCDDTIIAEEVGSACGYSFLNGILVEAYVALVDFGVGNHFKCFGCEDGWFVVENPQVGFESRFEDASVSAMLWWVVF